MRLAGGEQQDDEERQEKQDVERDEQLQRHKGRAVGDGNGAFHDRVSRREKRRNG